MFNTKTAEKINIVLAVLMFVYLVMTFIPCAVYNGDQVTSFQNYVWFVPDGVNNYIDSLDGAVDNSYDINIAVLGPIICSVCSVFGIFISIIFRKKGASAILPTIVGIVGIIDCLLSGFMSIVTIRFVFLILFVIITILGIYNSVTFAKDYSDRRKAGEF